MLVPRISASSYSNTAPLIWSFLYGSNRGKCELILDNAPARSAELLASGRIDAALVPVIEYQRIENVLIIPDVCVGAKEKVRSVCLITKGEDLEAVKSVSLDVSSRASVALTKIIFREFLNKEPVYRISDPNLDEMLSASDCALLIGDPALSIADCGLRIADLSEPPAVAGGFKRDEENSESEILNSKFEIRQNQSTKTEDQTNKKQIRKFDLAEVWKKYTGFGFVFAMWMTPEAKKETAKTIDFAAARDEGLHHLDEIISNYESEIPLSREEFRKYLSENISYSIDENMQKGFSLFYELAAKNNLIENFKKVRFIK